MAGEGVCGDVEEVLEREAEAFWGGEGGGDDEWLDVGGGWGDGAWGGDCCCALGADVAGCDAAGRVVEEVALVNVLAGLERGVRVCETHGEDVEHAQNEDDGAGGEDDAPARRAEGLLAEGRLVQVAEQGDAQCGHCEAEEDEAVLEAEQGPGARKVGPEEGEFGDDKKCCGSCQEEGKIDEDGNRWTYC